MIQVDVELASATLAAPDVDDLETWAREALRGLRDQAELAIRVVDVPESARLNEDYRGKQGATNVLSFPADLPAGELAHVLGDIVVCGPVVEAEAREQGKPGEAHWAHMIVHGVLHLLGYDHQQAGQAEEMEKLEAAILARLGYPDPY